MLNSVQLVFIEVKLSHRFSPQKIIGSKQIIEIYTRVVIKTFRVIMNLRLSVLFTNCLLTFGVN